MRKQHKLDSPSHLTEFAPLTDDIPKPVVTSFSWSRFFKRNKPMDNSSDYSSSSAMKITDSDAILSESICDRNIPNMKDETPDVSDSSSNEFYTDQSKSLSSNGSDERENPMTKEDTRSFTNVLRRISNILDQRLSTSHAYKDSDFKQYWMPDRDCKECYDCGDKFTTFRRRHHCRVCGQIFCSRCCNQEIPGKIIGCSGDLRVCKYCSKMVLSYLQSADILSDSTTSNLRSLQEDLRNKLSLLDMQSDSSTYEFGSRGMARRKNSVGFHEQSFTRSRAASTVDAPIFAKTRESSTMDRNNSELKHLIQDSVQLKELWLQIQNPIHGIQFHNHRHRLTTYPSCVVGSELVDWLIAEDKACSRLQAVAICQALIDSRYLEPVINQENVFLDEYALYRAGPVGLQETSRAKVCSWNQHPEQHEGQEPTWVKEINQDAYGTGHDTDEYEELIQSPSRAAGYQRMQSSNSMFYVTLDAEESRACLNRVKEMTSVGSPEPRSMRDSEIDTGFPIESSSRVTSRNDPSRTSISDDLLKGALGGSSAPYQDFVEETSIPIGWHSLLNLRQDNGEKLAYERMSLAYEQHERSLLCQLLSCHGLSQSWADVILPIVRKVAETVRPDERHDCDEMDIRQYVQFKKIPGGKRSECAIVNGVVCTKNIAHKKMKSSLLNPTILLVRSPIVYQRQENKLLSLEAAVLQEHNYLKNVVAKIACFKPDIVLVEKTVSRVAQDFFLDLDITLVLNVKPSVLDRTARLTQGDIVSSIDAQITKPNLGMCHNFHIVTFTLLDGSSKTLMFFDGCAQHLGCTVILRGAGNVELSKVKVITQFMTYVYYNWRLERSFLMDEFVMPPTPPDEKHFVIDEEDCLFTKTHSESVSESNAQETDYRSELSKSDSDSVEVETGVVLCFNENNEAEKQIFNMEASISRLDSDTERLSREKRCESRPIDDHSDPLHSYQKSEDDSIFLVHHGSQLQVSSLPLANRFRKALDDIVLSSSPNSKYSVPYLESEVGRKCKLRSFFPEEAYWSEQFYRSNKTSSAHLDEVGRSMTAGVTNGVGVGGISTSGTRFGNLVSDGVNVRSHHLFTALMLTAAINDHFVQESLSDYRAQGGRISVLNSKETKRTSLPQTNAINVACNRDFVDGAAAYNTSYWVDALDPFNHQRLSVLFCSYSNASYNAPSFCVSPWVVNMHFYGCNDISLGGFLEKYCFRSTYICPSEACETPMTEHVRRFVHDNGCVHILLRKMEHPIKRWPESISMWSWCRKCKQVTNVAPMSLDTWSLSFAKYLELRFHGGSYLRRGASDGCSHSLHHDHYQYFAYKQIVTAFKYCSIVLREIALPPCLINCRDVITIESLVEEVKELSVKGHGVYGSVLDRLFTLNSECVGTKYEQVVADLLAQLQSEKNYFRERIEDIQIKLTSPTIENVSLSDVNSKQLDVSLKDAKDHLWRVNDCIIGVKRIIADAVAGWDIRFSELVQQRKKDEKSSTKSTLVNIKTISAQVGSQPIMDSLSPRSEIGSNTIDSSIADRGFFTSSSLQPILQSDSDEILTNASINVTKQEVVSESVFEKSDVASNSHLSTSEFFEPNGSLLSTCESIDTMVPCNQQPNGGSRDESRPSETRNEKPMTSDGDDKIAMKSRFKLPLAMKSEDESIDTNAGKIEKKASGTVKNMLSQLLSTSSTVLLQNPFCATEHHLLPRCEKVPVVVYEDEPSSIIAYALSSPGYELSMQELKLSAATNQQKDSRNSSPVLKRKSAPKETTVTSNNLDSLAASSVDVFQVPVRRMGFGPMLSLFRNCERGTTETTSWPSRPSATTFQAVHYTANVITDKETSGSSSLTDEDAGDLLLSGQDIDKSKSGNTNKFPNVHVEVQFADVTAKFYCRVYFAEQFLMLRRLIFPDGEEAYCRSLSRCIDWMAKGGKSGCTFRKTRDDRFILKQMTRLEVQSFLDFAPHYVQYVTKACMEQRPTVLAKIVGSYRIVYRNIQTNATSKMDLLVMENLFYGRSVNQRFDLKGSVRNRLVNTAGKHGSDTVLLDENLLKMTCDKPLYIRPHSKTVLTLAINNDTQFLAQHLVMDYSLLVGIDDEDRELVIGIIDYIRTFTWDKKLETFVKSSGFLGGQGKMPTVVSPELYRTRFCEAMDGYFLGVPDRWSNLGLGVDC